MFRQWLLLVGGLFFIVYFLVCARRLYMSANKKLSFDVLVLIVESGKLILYLICNFLFMHQEMYIAVQIVQTIIQYVICCSFIDKVLVIAEMDRLQHYVRIGQAIFILVFFVLAIVIDVVGKLTCNQSTLGSDWILFMTVGIIQSLLIVASSVYLSRTKRERMIKSQIMRSQSQTRKSGGAKRSQAE